MGNARHSIVWVALSIGALFFAGCSKSIRLLDNQEGRYPLIQEARAKELEGDVVSAIRLYEQALQKNPRLVRAHLDLALLLQDHVGDYTNAVYHYRKYLALRPATEKREMIEDRIRQTMLTATSDVCRADSTAIGKLGSRKNELAGQGETGEQLEKSRKKGKSKLGETARDVKTQRVPDSAVSPLRRNGSNTYIVKSGDTLSSIAGQLYNDRNKWKLIAEANRDALRNSDSLKVGQILTIPY